MSFQTLPGLRILMYHSIGDPRKDPQAIAPLSFENQILFISRYYQVVSLKDALINLNWTHPTWGFGKIILTFDDAYQDFLTTAVPILKRYDVCATLFVPTRWVGHTSMWHSYDKTKPLLTWDELREVCGLGFDIASHTVTHPFLTQCSDADLSFELEESLTQLKSELPDVLPVLSYPGGYRGQREMKAAQSAGYLAAVGVTSRLANYPWTNRYHLRRCRWQDKV